MIDLWEVKKILTIPGMKVLVFKLLRKADQCLKRTFDILAASIGLVLLIPAFCIICVLIRRDSPGPFFYWGPRVGRHGRPFRILKFRTMYEKPESYAGSRITAKEDSRVTPVGRWLRNTKINELPQLWNVLIGNMSLVGPRPEDPKIIRSYPWTVREEILSVRPGITSPASVLYHSEEDLLTSTDPMRVYFKEILPDKMRLDQLYVQNRSFASDLDTILWTLAIYIPRIGRSRIPEGYLFAGPLSRFLHRSVSWFLVDFMIALAAILATVVVWRIHEPLNWGWEPLAVLAFALALIFSAVNHIAGLQRILWSNAGAEDAVRLFLSAGSVTLFALFFNQLQVTLPGFSHPALPLEAILCIGLLTQFGYIFARYRCKLLVWTFGSLLPRPGIFRSFGERLLILGDGAACQAAIRLLQCEPLNRAFIMVGILATNDPTKQGMEVNGCRILGGIGDLQTIAQKFDVRLMLDTIGDTEMHIRKRVWDIGESLGIKVVFPEYFAAYLQNGSDSFPKTNALLEEMREALPVSLHASLTARSDARSLSHIKKTSLPEMTVVISLYLEGAPLREWMCGKATAEQILNAAASRIRACTRKIDTLSRTVEHEFIFLPGGLPDKDSAHRLLGRLGKCFADPFMIQGRRWTVKSQIGLYADHERPSSIAVAE